MTARSQPRGPAGVFTLQDAFIAGWTADAIRHAVGSGRWVRLRSGSYLEVQPRADDAPFRDMRRQLLQVSIATAMQSDVAVLSHASAAVAQGLPLLPATGR